LARLQRWLIVSQRDLMQVAPAGKTGANGLAHKQDERALIFMRRGWSNPLSANRSELLGVEYHLENGRLERHLGESQRVMLEEVNGFQARFMDEAGQWRMEWKPQPAPLAELPQAVEIILKIKGIGTLRQLVPLAVLFKEEQKGEMPNAKP
jgi:type II secretion system protein J